MRNILFGVVTLVLMGSCKFDDPVEITTYDFLAGQWSLVHVRGGIAGVDDDFEEGVITWTFNAVNQSVTIANNNTEPVLLDGLPSGTYPFDIVEGEEFEELVVNELNLGIIECVDTGLVHIDQRVADGVALTFAR